MNSTSTDFSLQTLEARFEMQAMVGEQPSSNYMREPMIDEGCVDCGGGGGGMDYGYYGGSWDDLGEGDGYVGVYQQASDGSGAMLDDGTYTDGSGGSFPAYQQEGDPTCPQTPCPPNPRRGCKCTICRC